MKLIEAKAASLFIDEKLDNWIKDNLSDSKFCCWDITRKVPDLLKMACVNRGLEQIKALRAPDKLVNSNTEHGI
ncbi:MAG: hypothetical protein V4489_05505 [Chlamydiota bacterium]